MRRTILLLATMAAALVMVSGVALAVAISGGPGDDTIRGTKGTLLNERPHHPQERTDGHHQVDRDLEPLQHD
jgi:hypothetical protein